MCDLDGHFFAGRGVTHDDNESTLNARDTVTLIAKMFDFHRSPFTLFDRWARIVKTPT